MKRLKNIALTSIVAVSIAGAGLALANSYNHSCPTRQQLKTYLNLHPFVQAGYVTEGNNNIAWNFWGDTTDGNTTDLLFTGIMGLNTNNHQSSWIPKATKLFNNGTIEFTSRSIQPRLQKMCCSYTLKPKAGGKISCRFNDSCEVTYVKKIGSYT